MTIDAATLSPNDYVWNKSWNGHVGDRSDSRSGDSEMRRTSALEKSLKYMGLDPGQPLLGKPVDVVFIGSCTNSRITDLRQAALIQRKASRSKCSGLVVPGSHAVKNQAESEGIDKVFKQAGAEWREPDVPCVSR